MREIFNAKAIHANGAATLQIGIRGNGFIFNKVNNVVKLTNLSTNQAIPIQTTFLDSNGDSLETRLNTLASYFENGVLKAANGGTANSSVDSTPTENSTKMVTSGGVYSALEQKASKDLASSSTAGLMSSTQYTKLEGIATGATRVLVDGTLTESSTNPVSSAALYTIIHGILDRLDGIDALLADKEVMLTT